MLKFIFFLLRGIYPDPKTETLYGVYPEPKTEILRFAQDDRRRRAQDDRRGAQGNSRKAQNDCLGLFARLPIITQRVKISTGLIELKVLTKITDSKGNLTFFWGIYAQS
jgi:hypothetical protein